MLQINNKIPAPQTKLPELKIDQFLMDVGSLNLDDIVGQDKAIHQLKLLVDSIGYRDLYDVWKLSVPKGIILTGPTGVGKTASVRALAKELKDKVTLMELRYIDIASRWIDMPIEQLRQFFSMAEQYSKNKHVIIFIDELEAMLPERDGQIHETSVKRVDVFLEWLDGGFSVLKNITVIGATNNLEMVDKAARRPGRFDRIVQFEELTVPNIIRGLQIHLTKRGLSNFQVSDFVIRNLPNIGDGYLTGADLPEIINRVIERKVQIHKNRIISIHKNLLKLSIAERSEIFKNAKFFPEPISIDDIYIVVEEYICDKVNRKDIAKQTQFGFITFENQLTSETDSINNI